MKTIICILALLFGGVLPQKQDASGLESLRDLKAGQKRALEKRQPMLVIFGAEWCGPCKMLEKEMEKKEVAEKLAAWTVVHIDVDKSADAVGMMAGGGAIPHLKIMSATGRTIAMQTGFMSGDELLKWLGEYFDTAIAEAGEELTGATPPTGEQLGKLLSHLKQPEPALREAAIRRLSPHPALAAKAAVEAFGKGNLATRLSVMELLEAWKAPSAGLDPWRPETITPERLKALVDWAAKSAGTPGPTTKPAALSNEQLQQARQELARLVESDASEAAAIRERLARLGPVLSVELDRQLKSAGTDQARSRLGALRYRLAMSDSLALAWPSGVEQLASRDAKVRHAAVGELQTRATPGDAALLMILFADPDPLVREMALRAMGGAAGAEGTGALLELLKDPDANVRAAVLKQFAEQPPTSSTIEKIGEYAMTETDSDLVVHAVRVFRASKKGEAQAALLKLTAHESWRVRAEAVEALAEMTNPRGGNNSNPEATRAAVKLLEDTDSFVASQAANMLKQSNLSSSFDAIMKAAEAHPELAANILPQIGEDDELKTRALPYLTKFAAHADPAVRAAAVKGLGAVGGAGGGEPIKNALKDSDERVRIAAADATFAAMEDLRPRDGMIKRRKKKFLVFNGEEVEEQVDSSKWLADFRAGKDRPAWLNDAAAELDKLLQSKSEQERASAALPLVALGHEQNALPVLMARADASAKSLTSALPWLPIQKRLEVFNKLIAETSDEHQKGRLVYAMAEMPDPATRKPLWDLLAGKDVSKELTSSVQQALLKMYLTERYWNIESLPKAKVKETVKDNRERAASGSDAQRVAAMSILLNAAQADAAEVAEKIYRDAAASQNLREDALHVLMVASEKAEGTKLAVEALASDQKEMRSLALAYLAEDEERLSYLRGGPYARSTVTRVYYNGQQTPELKGPAGVKEEMLTPFIKAGGKEGALAGYLLALMGNNVGMDLLLGQWRAHQEEYSPWKTRVYRAIAALNDEKYVPVLEEMYSKWDKNSYLTREFYWTIRAMTGERILALRKKIRDEVGMSNLR